MDERSESAAGDPLIVTGLGHVVSTPCDSTRYLKVRKNRKFMGVQDELAVTAAGRALEAAGLGPSLGGRAGLYMAVGHVPFEQSDIDQLMAGSVDKGGFSMPRFSTEGVNGVNPLLTFRCLSNMPAYHISANFDLQGPYFVTYPGPGQFYLALEEACFALRSGEIDVALVAGVAHQRNFLVTHHFGRLGIPAGRLVDSAGCVILQRGGRARGRLLEMSIAYRAHNPFEDEIESTEESPAALPVALGSGSGLFRHEVRTRDGITASSVWELE